ncbi:MAG: amino acid--tRNA ligase-related protein [Candidatus Heimdallarchaeaceae archaeon]
MVVLEKEKSDTLRYISEKTTELKSALSIQHVVLFQTRRILDDLGFVEVLAPVTKIGKKTNIRNEKNLSFNHNNFPVKAIHQITIFKQALMCSFERIYTIFPKTMPETLSTVGSFEYLRDIYQLHLEIKEKTMYDCMETTELFLESLFESVKIICANVLEKSSRDFVVPSFPFPQISYTKIHELTASSNYSFAYGKKIPNEVIETLSKKARRPFWIVNHPIDSKEILYREDLGRPGFLLSANLVLPDGFGVLATGGERENDINKITNLLKKSNENLSQYKWYLDMMENEEVKSTGIEIGIEKLTRYILGLQNVG